MAPLRGQGDPGRVIEGRHRVEELDPFSLTGQGGETFLERFGDDPVVVHGDVLDVGLVGGEGVDRGHVRGPLGQHHVAGVDEDFGDEVQCLLGTDGDDHVVRTGVDLLEGHNLADLLAQHRVALG